MALGRGGVPMADEVGAVEVGAHLVGLVIALGGVVLVDDQGLFQGL